VAVGGRIVAVGDGDEVTVAVGVAVEDGLGVIVGVLVLVGLGVLVGGRGVAVGVDVDVGG